MFKFLYFFFIQVHGKNKGKTTTFQFIHGVELTFSFIRPCVLSLSLSFYTLNHVLSYLYCCASFFFRHRKRVKIVVIHLLKHFFRRVFISEMYSTKLKYCILTILLIHYCSSNDDTYKEELYIRPLSTGHTYLNLLFTTVVSPDILKPNISKLFFFLEK